MVVYQLLPKFEQPKVIVWRNDGAFWEPLARMEPYIRGHELPLFIETFDSLVLEYGELGL